MPLINRPNDSTDFSSSKLRSDGFDLVGFLQSINYSCSACKWLATTVRTGSVWWPGTLWNHGVKVAWILVKSNRSFHGVKLTKFIAKNSKEESKNVLISNVLHYFFIIRCPIRWSWTRRCNFLSFWMKPSHQKCHVGMNCESTFFSMAAHINSLLLLKIDNLFSSISFETSQHFKWKIK